MSANMDHDLVNLVIHGSNGQQQVIKIMRNPNGQPLTQEGVKAIVKEYMNNSSNSSESYQAKFSGSISTSNGTISSSSSGVTASASNVTLVASSQAAATSVAVTTTAAPTYQSTSAPAHISTRSSAASSGSAKSTGAVAPPPMAKYASKQSTSKMQSHGGGASGTGGSGSTSFGGNSGGPSPAPPKKTRRRKTDRVGKGLRHFSMKVCEKVKEKGTTTYNEVADELVEEFCSQEARGQPVDPASFDQKNIRRRVYDALNVLMAMNIISKDKKEIRWIGLPTNSAQQCSALEKENQKRKERIEAKQQQLRELILQQVSFKSLVTRNKESEERGIVPSPSSAIQMPFIIVNTHKKTHVNCSISNDKSEYQFKFDDTFEIHDDIEVLKRMGLLLGLDTGDCSHEDIERAKTMVPKAFEKYIELYGRGQEDLTYDDADMYNEDAIIMKTEQMSDEEELDDDHYTDSDME